MKKITSGQYKGAFKLELSNDYSLIIEDDLNRITLKNNENAEFEKVWNFEKAPSLTDLDSIIDEVLIEHGIYTTYWN